MSGRAAANHGRPSGECVCSVSCDMREMVVGSEGFCMLDLFLTDVPDSCE